MIIPRLATATSNPDSPSFTILVGTIGRPSIANLIHSFISQDRVRDDQLIITMDALDMDQGTNDRMEGMIGEGYRDGVSLYQHKAEYHHLGVPQINWAWRNAPITGTHILTLGDDDVLIPGAMAKLRKKCAANPGRPILYQFLAPWREILWDRPELIIGRISGCCLAAPIEFNISHPTSLTYQEPTHDYEWICGVVRMASKAGREAVWWDEVIVVARPDIYPVQVT